MATTKMTITASPIIILFFIFCLFRPFCFMFFHRLFCSLFKIYFNVQRSFKRLDVVSPFFVQRNAGTTMIVITIMIIGKIVPDGNSGVERRGDAEEDWVGLNDGFVVEDEGVGLEGEGDVEAGFG